MITELAFNPHEHQAQFDHLKNIKYKKCIRCGIEFPETRQYFGNFKNKSGGVVRIGFRGACRKCMAAHTRKYDAQHPESVSNRQERRSERSAAAPGKAPRDLPRIRKILGDKCRFCSTKLNRRGHIDHLTPVARGGTHSQSNLTLCCSTCNLEKTSKTLDEHIEWRKERRLSIRAIVVPGENPDPALRDYLRGRY